MWALGMAGIAEQCENLTSTRSLANTHANAFRLEMAVKGEIILPQIEEHVIAGNGLKRDGHGSLVRTPFVLRYAVLHIGYHSIGDGEHLRAVRKRIRIV